MNKKHYIKRFYLFVKKVWMTFSKVLGWLMTKVILSLIFYIMVFPISIISKIFNKSFLDVKIDKSKDSYWVYRDASQAHQKDYYEKQF